MATSVDDVTDQLLVGVFLGVAGEGSVASHSGSGRAPTSRSAASRKALLSLLRPRLLPAADIFCGDHLLCARLRSSNIDASAGSPEEMQRVVAQIRVRWPMTRIILSGNELADHAFE